MNTKIFYSVAIISILLFLSCFNNKSEIAKELLKLQSNPIVLPVNYNVIAEERDTIITNFMRSDIKLIIYTDSSSCSLCEINKMYQWDGFIEYAKSYNEQLKLYFIFYPPKDNIRNIKLALKNGIFSYPVIIDSLGEFERLNPHLPKNSAFHTFLLDENNKVILVGNPLNNKEVEKLFYKKTQELLAK